MGRSSNGGYFLRFGNNQILVNLEGELRNFIGKNSKEGELIDTWIEAVERCREEDYYAKKYWAFLNGYLNVKMAQLLARELSIVETSVKMYIRKIKQDNPEAAVDESMGVGKFLEEMKDEPDILVGFSLFIAEELVASDEDEGGKAAILREA